MPPQSPSATKSTPPGEVNYYFQQVYQSFLSENSYFISYLGLDTSKDLRDQAYPGSEDGQTWFDYFLDQAIQQMTTVKALNDDAPAQRLYLDG